MTWSTWRCILKNRSTLEPLEVRVEFDPSARQRTKNLLKFFELVGSPLPSELDAAQQHHQMTRCRSEKNFEMMPPDRAAPAATSPAKRNGCCSRHLSDVCLANG